MNRLLPPLLAAAYPLLAHAAAHLGSERLALVAAADLILLLLWPGLSRPRALAWLALAAAAAGLAWLAALDLATLPLYAPPVLFNLFMAWVFGHTLGDGRVPLIERVVRLLHGGPETLDPAIARYARRLTLAWTALFLVLATVNFALALLAVPDGLLASAGVAPPWPVARETWSLFANLLNYAIVGAFFALEYAWRRRKFDLPYASFGDFCLRMARLGPAFWRGAR